MSRKAKIYHLTICRNKNALYKANNSSTLCCNQLATLACLFFVVVVPLSQDFETIVISDISHIIFITQSRGPWGLGKFGEGNVRLSFCSRALWDGRRRPWALERTAVQESTCVVVVVVYVVSLCGISSLLICVWLRRGDKKRVCTFLGILKSTAVPFCQCQLCRYFWNTFLNFLRVHFSV